MNAQTMQMFFNMVSTLQVKFCKIPCCRSWDLRILKNVEKVEWQCPLFSDVHEKLISPNLCQDATIYKFSLNFACQFSCYLSCKIYVTYRHSLKVLKSYSGYSKAYKSIKNRKLNSFSIPNFLLMYAEESKMKT